MVCLCSMTTDEKTNGWCHSNDRSWNHKKASCSHIWHLSWWLGMAQRTLLLEFFPNAWAFSRSGSLWMAGLLAQQVRTLRVNIPENKLGTVWPSTTQPQKSRGLSSIIAHWSSCSEPGDGDTLSMEGVRNNLQSQLETAIPSHVNESVSRKSGFGTEMPLANFCGGWRASWESRSAERKKQLLLGF